LKQFGDVNIVVKFMTMHIKWRNIVPFWKSKKPAPEEIFKLALEEMLPAAFEVKEKWLKFNSILKFKDDVPLTQIVKSFSTPLGDFFAKKYPNIFETIPIVYLSTIVIGIHLAETHDAQELKNLARDMEKESHISGIQEIVDKFTSGLNDSRGSVKA
jgi:hypothetical protein